MLKAELANHPNQDFVHYLLGGLEEGFHTGVTKSCLKSFESKNLLSARDDPDLVSTIIKDEINKGYLKGPFDLPPYTNYRVSPIGLAEHKYNGKIS